MIEFKRILCAVDSSEFSRRALDSALSVARGYGSAVTALHVVAPVDAARLARAAIIDCRRLSDESEKSTGRESEHARPCCLIPSALSVTGVRARNALDLALLGSTTQQVVRLATVPVLTIRG